MVVVVVARDSADQGNKREKKDGFAGSTAMGASFAVSDGTITIGFEGSIGSTLGFVGSIRGMVGGVVLTYSLGGIGVPAGGMLSEPQWKMRVATAWTCVPFPPWEEARFVPAPVSTMVIISPVSWAWTW
jgi:hypothetical protein